MVVLGRAEMLASFCLATLCTNAAFGVVQRPSVWLVGWVSVTFVYCVETAKNAAIVTMECE